MQNKKIHTFMKYKKTIIALVAAAVILLAAVLSGFILFMGHPLQITKPTYIYIDQDDNIDSVYTKLKTQLNASSLTGFRILVKAGKYADNIHEGAYRFSPETSTWQIYHHMQTGNQTPVKLTVPSVRTMGQLSKTLARKLMTDSASIARLITDSASCAKMGFTTYTIPTLFVPNTYEVYWNISADDLMKRIKKEHDRFWNTERTGKAASIGLTPEEVCTVASIVEEETANKAEKPMVAGLYINRLHAGMLLQADPTVKFALQEFGLRRILHKHLEADNPYNTYKHQGLPPGPIRIASIEGIDAVLNYTHHDFLYMCAKEDFSGTHNFAVTWNEHLANARRYQRALNQRNIK